MLRSAAALNPRKHRRDEENDNRAPHHRPPTVDVAHAPPRARAPPRRAKPIPHMLVLGLGNPALRHRDDTIARYAIALTRAAR